MALYGDRVSQAVADVRSLSLVVLPTLRTFLFLATRLWEIYYVPVLPLIELDGA